jgi:hypothetical protein
MLQASVRPVEGRVYTNDFRVHGTFHLRSNTGTAWLLNADDRPHLPMTNVSMYRPGIEDTPRPEALAYETHFAALPKSSIVWMQGGGPDSVQQEGFGRQPRLVYLVYPTYVIAGTFALRTEVRLSDFVAAAMGGKSFVTLTDARVLGPGSRGQTFAELPVVQSHPFIVVNLKNVGGIFDDRGGDPGKAYVVEG